MIEKRIHMRVHVCTRVCVYVYTRIRHDTCVFLHLDAVVALRVLGGGGRGVVLRYTNGRGRWLRNMNGNSVVLEEQSEWV